MLKSKFILNILYLLLDGKKTKFQIDLLTESEYKYTGSGVYIYFGHNNDIEKHKIPKNNLVLNGVTIKSTELAFGANCTLFIEDGLITYLEIHSNDGNYPKKELSNYELSQKWENSPKRKIKVE